MQTNQGGAAAGTSPAPMNAEDINKAVAAAIAASLPAALSAHDKAKTERRAAITGCDEAKKRQKLAAHLADNTSMSADEAKAMLAVAAEETPEKKGSGSNFHNAMNNTGNPNVGADNEGNGGEGGGEGGGEPSALDMAATIQADYTRMTGAKVVPIKRAG